MRIKCAVCNATAVWRYAPDPEDRAYCEDHVPRGCSCNLRLKPGIAAIWEMSEYGHEEISNPEEDWELIKDESGREAPCCEYDKL